MIFHENQLLNHRITWLLTFNSFLFATIGLLLSNMGDCVSIIGASASRWLIMLVSGLGMLIALIALVLIRRGNVATNTLATKQREDYPCYEGPPIIGLGPKKKDKQSDREKDMKQQLADPTRDDCGAEWKDEFPSAAFAHASIPSLLFIVWLLVFGYTIFQDWSDAHSGNNTTVIINQELTNER